MSHIRIVSSTPLEIHVPREFAWGILIDLPRYHLWNPLSARIESSLRLGDPVRLWVSDAAITGKTEIVEHRLVERHDPEHIAWAFERGEVKTRRDQFLDPAPAGCIYRTSDSFYGPLADAMMDGMGESIFHSFNRLAASFRDFCENAYRTD